MKRALRIVAGVLAVAAGFWGYRILFPPDETQIRRHLTKMVEVAELKPGETRLARLAAASRLAGFFTTDVEVSVDQAGGEWANASGRNQIQTLILGARSTLRQLHVELVGITVELDPGRQTARAYTTALVDVNGEKQAGLQELRLELRKDERQWRIARVQTTSTVRDSP